MPDNARGKTQSSSAHSTHSGRSLGNLVELVKQLKRRIDHRSLQKHIVTATPTGRLNFRVFGLLAEFDREPIRERTEAGPQAPEHADDSVARDRPLPVQARWSLVGQGRFREVCGGTARVAWWPARELPPEAALPGADHHHSPGRRGRDCLWEHPLEPMAAVCACRPFDPLLYRGAIACSSTTTSGRLFGGSSVFRHRDRRPQVSRL